MIEYKGYRGVFEFDTELELFSGFEPRRQICRRPGSESHSVVAARNAGGKDIAGEALFFPEKVGKEGCWSVEEVGLPSKTRFSLLLGSRPVLADGPTPHGGLPGRSHVGAEGE